MTTAAHDLRYRTAGPTAGDGFASTACTNFLFFRLEAPEDCRRWRTCVDRCFTERLFHTRDARSRQLVQLRAVPVQHATRSFNPWFCRQFPESPMRIGYSFWGFLADGVLDTPDGARSYRRPVIDALQRAGNHLVLV